jgi:hypothetical protein
MLLDLKLDSVDTLDSNQVTFDQSNFFVIVFSVTYTDSGPNYFWISNLQFFSALVSVTPGFQSRTNEKAISPKTAELRIGDVNEMFPTLLFLQDHIQP